VHEAVESYRAWCIYEHYAVEFIDEAALEEERYVADDHPIAAGSRRLDLLLPEEIHGWVHDAVQGLQLLRIVKNAAPESSPIEQAVRRENLRAPAFGDAFQGWRPSVHSPSGQLVSVDDHGAKVGQTSRYGRLPGGNVPRETYHKRHDCLPP
jgi:hypothetical protein